LAASDLQELPEEAEGSEVTEKTKTVVVDLKGKKIDLNQIGTKIRDVAK